MAVELKASGSRRSETKIKILTKPWDGRITIVQLVIYFCDTTYVYDTQLMYHDTLGVRLNNNMRQNSSFCLQSF